MTTVTPKTSQTSTLVWKTIDIATGSPKPSMRWGHSACTVDDSLYIFGGFASKNAITQIPLTWTISGSTKTCSGRNSKPMETSQKKDLTVHSAMTPSITNYSSSEEEEPTNNDLTLWAHSISIASTGFKSLPSKAKPRRGKEPTM